MEKFDAFGYFNEHVLYELQMLRYSKNQLGTPVKTPDDQFHWNCMFAAFNVSARNLYDFLKGDPGNRSITDYNEYRKSTKSINVSDISLGKIHAQCFHMGSSRTKAPEDKVTYERIVELFDWVELKVKKMFDNFKEEFTAAIDWKKANWQPIPVALAESIKLGPSGGSGEVLMLKVGTRSATATTASPSQEITTSTIPPESRGPRGP